MTDREAETSKEEVTMAEKPVRKVPIRNTRNQWGPWRLRLGNLTLEHDTEGYYVDLERCQTSAAVLDWICQVAGKGWADASTVGHLVVALDDVLEPQRNLCSGEVEQGPVRWVRPT